jgi:DNA-binding NtrC family response regulator
VLIVDDDVDTCRNLTDIFTDVGYEAEAYCDGESALERVRVRAFDVALLDLRMPGMDGLTLLREIKKLQAGMTALIITAHAEWETARDALAEGAYRVLRKPIDIEQLLPLIAKLVERPLVMVVDDDQDLCASLCDVLHECGFRVCLANDTPRAAALLDEPRYRAVLIDMKLPSAGGDSVFRLVRSRSPGSRVLLMTGHRDEYSELIQELVQQGAEAVYYKPFDVPGLLEALRQLTAGGETNN